MVNGRPSRNLTSHWDSKFNEYVEMSRPEVSYHTIEEKVTGAFPVEISLTSEKHFSELISNIDVVAPMLVSTGSVALLWVPEELDEWVLTSPTVVRIINKFRSHGVKVVSVCSDMYRKTDKNLDKLVSMRLSVNIFDQATKNCLEKEGFSPNDVIKVPTKHFICLNNIIRPGKLYTLSQLARKDLLKNGHVSALNSNRSNRYEVLFDDISRCYLSDNGKKMKQQDVRDFISRHLSYSEDPPVEPLELDVSGKSFDPWGFYYDYMNKPFGRLLPYHNDSCISIVNETESTWVKNHQFSEKIYLPIAFKTPFMVCGNPGYLAQLRSQGYQTFPELFDESYDDVDDPIKRADMIVSQLETFCSKSIDEAWSLVRSVQEKLDYNHALLLSYRDHGLSLSELFNKISCFIGTSNGSD
jgi:hypothetical protein